MGLKDDRQLPTSRANNTFSDGIGLERIDMEQLEREIEEERKKRETPRERFRIKVTEDLNGVWMDYLNKRTNQTGFFDAITDYVVDNLYKD